MSKNKDLFDWIANNDINSIETLYEQYSKNPESIDVSWHAFFKGFDFALSNFDEKVKTEDSAPINQKEFQVVKLIQAYRQRGHLFTATNPVRNRRKYFPTLDIENFGLTEQDLNTEFEAGHNIGLGKASLKTILDHLKATYCKSIGIEYLYMRHPEVVEWLQNKMESTKNTIVFSNRQKTAFYKQLMKAVNFEQFIHKKFIGEKRFSLEGSEVLIPAITALGIRGAEMGVKEYVIGMAHRGRLNVLGNVLQKPYEDIFREFEGDEYEEHISLGDVKYHLGYGNDTKLANHDVRLNLVPNPSHLETVMPITNGIARAKAEHNYDGKVSAVVPIVIHGDAAIAGQGVVYETVQMSQLPGYRSGGTVHIVINNQVGFTTGYLEARSSTYCTDIAKVNRAPVFHVNGDDVEAMVYVAQLAMEFRQKFDSDVFIDILSYRKFGHNEGDEPRFTQPVLYKIIENHPNPRDIYGKRLIEEGTIDQETLDKLNREFNDKLEEKLELARQSKKLNIRQFLPKTWKGFRHAKDEDFLDSPKTGVSEAILKDIAKRLTDLPKDKPFFKKAIKIVEDRKKMIKDNHLDWGLTELLAYGSLTEEGIGVRLSGQDAVRGTFAHRHAEVTYDNLEGRHKLFSNIGKKGGVFSVFNSPLSEYGVMGFEYGYALASPNTLTIWEAQFGDFHNVAQVIIDQFISSAEEKWGTMNGLVLYLPHGFEGQGPEHSSARIERFLSLAARNNMQIMNFTNPANLFHALRQQNHRDFRIPMVVFTPKSLLRHAKVYATLQDLSQGQFMPVIDDENTDTDEVKRVVFCSGKVYYDLLERKEALNARDVALIRLEQLHPFPDAKVKAIIAKYKNAILHLWVQEEPENQGPWRYIQNNLKGCRLIPVARRESGSPATGLKGLHKVGQEEIVNKVFRRCNCELKNKYCGLQCVDGKSYKEILKQHYYFQDESRFSI